MHKSLLPALLLLVVLTPGCNWNRIRGNGKIITEQRPVAPFTRVDAGGFYEIEWRPGQPSLSLTTDENLLSHIETNIRGDALKIETHGPLAPTHGIKVVITSPSFNGARLSGAGRLVANELSGAGFTLDTSGATKVTLAGQVGRLLASLTGASKLEAGALHANDVELSVTGAGKAEVFASNSLKAAITGAGKVTYAGSPKTVEKKISGAGKIEPRE